MKMKASVHAVLFDVKINLKLFVNSKDLLIIHFSIYKKVIFRWINQRRCRINQV